MNFAFHDIAPTALPAVVMVALIATTACGGGGGSTPPPQQQPSPRPPPAAYSIGGTVSGLDAGQSVVLQNNGGDNRTVSANVPFTFAIKVASGGAYAVTALTQPTGQTCTVAAGSATMPASNVDTVAVSCTNVWTWVSRANTGDAPGVYGALGTGSTANGPGARDLAISWINKAGNFWLFGGYAHDSIGAAGHLNDLWRF